MEEDLVLIAIALGGALGALARYGLGGWIQEHAGWSFPWGTFVVNAAGSLFLGVVLRVLEGVAAAPTWRAFLAIGVAGGFTTFSTFGYEGLMLLQGGETGRAAAYLAGSVAIGLGCVFIGLAAGGWILHWRA